MEAKRWIALTAASALGIGALAGSAVGIAHAMPLTDSATNTSVPAISTTLEGARGFAGTGDEQFTVDPTPTTAPAVTVVTPATPTPPSPTEPAPAPAPTVQPQPAPAPQPVAPASPVSVDSPDSPDSADSAD